MNKDLHVTKTFLPPMEQYMTHMKDIWASGIITNNGSKVISLEKRLKQYLEVDNLILVSNGTIAIQLIIKALGLKGNVITTPFSYVATTSSLLWQSVEPLFADIHPETLCLDVDNIIPLINENTTGILATHVFGNVAYTDKLDEISKSYGIPVIYDAAHAFGVQRNGRSVLEIGAASTLSFHATKVFHTIEGGAIITKDDELHAKMEYMRRFGHKTASTFSGVGINAKLSEMHAAMGHCVLDAYPSIIEKRRIASEYYLKLLNPQKNNLVQFSEDINLNYSYFPIILASEKDVLNCIRILNNSNIYPRRYFYPSLNELSYLDAYQPCPVSEDLSRRILCLPLSHSLSVSEIEEVSALVKPFVQ